VSDETNENVEATEAPEAPPEAPETPDPAEDSPETSVSDASDAREEPEAADVPPTQDEKRMARWFRLTGQTPRGIEVAMRQHARLDRILEEGVVVRTVKSDRDQVRYD
jgi:hypothetical protein